MDRERVDALLQHHLPSLRAFVRLRTDPLLRARESCSDLVQSVCAEVLQNADKIEDRGDERFRNMLYVAVLNKIRNHRRYYLADKRHPEREASQADDAQVWAAYSRIGTPSEHAVDRESALLLERAFDRLPDDYREVLTLTKLLGMSYAEVAEQLDRTVPSVRNLLNRAMLQLADALVEARRESQGPTKGGLDVGP